MSVTPSVVFLFDVDNTLLDNDQVQADLSEHLERDYGATTRDRYWRLFEELRGELGYADCLGALERYRLEDLHRPEILRMSNWLVDYPFADRLYPGAIEMTGASLLHGIDRQSANAIDCQLVELRGGQRLRRINLGMGCHGHVSPPIT
jgi:hypothetical protein